MKLRLEITGNLGGDAQLKIMDSGRQLVTSSVAHTEKWKTADGEVREKTYWIKFNWWFNGSTEVRILPYLVKGALISVEGMPEISTWIDKTTNEPKAMQELSVHKLWLLGVTPKKNEVNVPGVDAPPIPAEKPEDDLPF